MSVQHTFDRRGFPPALDKGAGGPDNWVEDLMEAFRRSTDVRAPADLAARIRTRMSAEPPSTAPRRFLAALRGRHLPGIWRGFLQSGRIALDPRTRSLLLRIQALIIVVAVVGTTGLGSAAAVAAATRIADAATRLLDEVRDSAATEPTRPKGTLSSAKPGRDTDKRDLHRAASRRAAERAGPAPRADSARVSLGAEGQQAGAEGSIESGADSADPAHAEDGIEIRVARSKARDDSGSPGDSEHAPPGQANGNAGGTPNGKAEGKTGSSGGPDGAPQGQASGKADGTPNGKAKGKTGSPGGPGDGAPDQANGKADGTPNGNSKGKSGSPGAPNGPHAPNGNANGQANGEGGSPPDNPGGGSQPGPGDGPHAPNGNANGQANGEGGSPPGNPGGGSQGGPEDSAAHAPNGNANGQANGEGGSPPGNPGGGSQPGPGDGPQVPNGNANGQASHSEGGKPDGPPGQADR
jgi:hypothetical protein